MNLDSPFSSLATTGGSKRGRGDKELPLLEWGAHSNTQSEAKRRIGNLQPPDAVALD